MEIWGGIGRGIRGFFNGMLRGVSNPCEGQKILTFLYRPRLVCRARSYISEARGRLILRTTSPCGRSWKYTLPRSYADRTHGNALWALLERTLRREATGAAGSGTSREHMLTSPEMLCRQAQALRPRSASDTKETSFSVA